MGNKNTSSPKGPDAITQQEKEADNTIGSFSRDEALGPELLASLQTLGENNDYTLLPHSLHQIAEAYSLQEDYQCAIEFLQLEKLYHERLLSNLAALQENWESQWRLKEKPDNSFPTETDSVAKKHFETLSHICRTHSRPSINQQQISLNATLKDIQSKIQTLQACQVDNPGTSQDDREREEKENESNESASMSPQTGSQDGREEEEETCEEGQEVEEEEEEEQCEETPEEEEVKVEWPTGVHQASDKDLAKLSNKDGSSSPDGLVSILKRRRASLDGLPPPSDINIKPNSKRKVRFSEPEDAIEHDEVSGDSCLILLLLCLVTVVISVGGTALYCTLVDTYSNICTDFTHNVNFYVTNLRRFVEGLGLWLPPRT